MGGDRACRYEPEGARGLERREDRDGMNICASPRRKAERTTELTAAPAALAADAFAVSIPSIGLSNAERNSPTKWAVVKGILPKRV